LNHPETDYVRHEVKYHPLANQFTIWQTITGLVTYLYYE
jgi:hypothetical protein